MKFPLRNAGVKATGLAVKELVSGHLNEEKDSTVGDDGLGVRRKGNDIFYHAMYVAVKYFLNESTLHTIEEMQEFADAWIPSLPGAHSAQTLVPLSCCDEAATNLIKALGGENAARRIVGGVKWWQVRAVNGIKAEWITMKKDLEEAKSMDNMRCILYLHGGGYYFGSINQTRFSSERFARKINGRVFAINYRLAPQYPFPCGLQDALAAYLFLIRPPPGSNHKAIDPAHIIISGDSAGGALALALLQVIRDTNLPPPAGGVLISPWCDLTHSFPSIDENTKKDYIPECGLSFHKPSTLWPPPPSYMAEYVHASLRKEIWQGLQRDTTIISETGVDHRSLDSPPRSEDQNPRLGVRMLHEDIEINDQLQFYTTNNLLNHPLVSPITGYLGGLPPLLFTAGDEEVLRDEIIYTAHKAAYPEKYPILPSSRSLYPHLQDIEQRHGPTSVHLQVYDATHHILPVLFTMTKPATFCFRAIANFDRFVTRMEMRTPTIITSSSSSGRGSLSGFPVEDPSKERSARMAGEPRVYDDIKTRSNWECRMIRERVSTSGITRDLEPEDELAACNMPLDRVAKLSDDMLRRFVKNKRGFDEKFRHEIKGIERERERNLAKAREETVKRVSAIRRLVSDKVEGEERRVDFYEGILTPPGCSWSWVLDERENPPLSSIVGRRDTKQARQLAADADCAI